MKSLRDPMTRQDLMNRVKNVTPDSQRKWERMESSQMMAHVADQLRMALGEVVVSKARGPFRFGPLRYLLVYVLPWPKGKATAPAEAFTTAPTDWAADQTTLLELVERYAKTPASKLNPLHPLFGRMTARDWDVLSYRHLDHHLRQFGA